MKRTFLPLLAFLTVSLNIVAQKTIDSGYIKMEITEVASDDEQTNMMLQMMKGTQTEVFFKGYAYVTSMDMMGGMVKTQTYVNEQSKSFDMLMDAMGQKYWINSDLDEARNSENSKVAENAKVTYDKDDTKKILGYNAYRVNIELPGQEGLAITGYVSEEIKTKANLMQGMESLKLNGYPLEFTVNNPQMKMTMTTVEINDKVDESRMEMRTEGFQKITMQEFTQQMGAGMGLGF